MNPGSNNLITGLLAGGLIVAYAALAHYTSTLPEAGHWAVLLAVVPSIVIGFGLLRSIVGNGPTWILTIVAAGLAFWAWPRLQQNVSSVYFLQHVGMNVALGLFFGRTLINGREPLCTHFASLVHERMSPELIRYSGQITAAWTLFFFSMAAVSALLYFLAPTEAWSIFANLLSLPLVVSMFVGDAIARRFTLPPEDRLGLSSTIAAYRKSMAMRAAGAKPDAHLPESGSSTP